MCFDLLIHGIPNNRSRLAMRPTDNQLVPLNEGARAFRSIGLAGSPAQKIAPHHQPETGQSGVDPLPERARRYLDTGGDDEQMF